MIIKSILVLTTFLSASVMASTDYKAIQESALSTGKSSYSASDLCSSSDTTCASQINNPTQASYYTSSTNSTTISKADSALTSAGTTAYNSSDMAEESAKRDAAEVDPDLTSSSYAILNNYIKDAATNQYAACESGTLGGGLSETTTTCYAETGNSLQCTYSRVQSQTETTVVTETKALSYSISSNTPVTIDNRAYHSLVITLPYSNSTITSIKWSGGCFRRYLPYSHNGTTSYKNELSRVGFGGSYKNSGEAERKGNDYYAEYYDLAWSLNSYVSGTSYTGYISNIGTPYDKAKDTLTCSLPSTVNVTYTRTVPALTWEKDCNTSVLEEYSCTASGKTCTSGAATKTVSGVSYYEDCWQQTENYTCPATDTCSSLETGKSTDELSAGETTCTASKKTCSLTVDGVCIQTLNTETCETKLPDTVDIDCGSASYCSSDDADQSLCTETTDLTSSTSMATALTELSLLKEFGDQFDSTTLKFFKGDADSCSKVVAGTKNCCADSGWATNAGLASCSTDEKDLAVAKGKNLTIKIGEYCAESILGACIRKKQTYCVYTSAIAKITMQAAIDQEGASLGSAKDPDCSGVTATVLGGVDFDKVDYSSIIGNVSVTVPDMSGVSSSVADQVGSDSYSNETSN